MNRRNFITQSILGLSSLSLYSGIKSPLNAKQPHFTPSAKRLVHIFLNGGPSHLDTFDYKPELMKYAGKQPPFKVISERKTGNLAPSKFKFQRYGNSGLEISSLFSNLAKHSDDMCIIKSMYTNAPNHEAALMMMNCGDTNQPRPSLGSWLTYGLGSVNSKLPGFIVLCPGGYPVKEVDNWRAAFLPPIYQGTSVDCQHREIEKLIANIKSPWASDQTQKSQIELLKELNRIHKTNRTHDSRLESRTVSFEIALGMQSEAQKAFNISNEPVYIKKLYGDTVHGRQFLTARRLLEKGVRVVQLWHGKQQPWDTHTNNDKMHQKLAGQIDGPISAFITDLKQRGLLDDTLIVIGGEFGRTPTVEGAGGRDHNHLGFSTVLIGGGIKGGMTYGQTDDFGYKAVENRVHVHDLHATILHSLGFDHERLTYEYAGRKFRLTDVHGKVIHKILS